LDQKLAGSEPANLAKTSNPAHMWRTIIRRNGDVNGGGEPLGGGDPDPEISGFL
jgi:hypothetical protein